MKKKQVKCDTYIRVSTLTQADNFSLDYSCSEVEQKEFMKAFIEKIELYPEKREDGCWIKHITLDFPVPIEGKEVAELSLENETTFESVTLLHRVK